VTVTAILLLVVSSVLHATWNLVSKRRAPAAAFFLLGTATAAVCLVPVLLWRWTWLTRMPAAVWLLLAGAGATQAMYFAALAGAYRSGDMSIAYPLARSSPLVVVTVVVVFLGRGDEVSTQCVLGILLIVGGCFVLPMRRFGELRLRNYLNLCCVLALLAAFGTAGYSMCDDEALLHLREAFGSGRAPLEAALSAALVYVALESVATSLFLALFVLLVRKERRALRAAFRRDLGWAALTGIAIFVTYGMALVSMAFVSNVSYVVAFRQLSIPLGAVLGVFLLGEPRHVPKFVGIAAITVGLVLVGAG